MLYQNIPIKNVSNSMLNQKSSKKYKKIPKSFDLVKLNINDEYSTKSTQ